MHNKGADREKKSYMHGATITFIMPKKDKTRLVPPKLGHIFNSAIKTIYRNTKFKQKICKTKLSDI